MRRAMLGLGAAVVLAACGDAGESGPTAEQLAMREAAARQACAARYVEDTAAENLATLEQARAEYDPEDPIGAITLQATSAATDFARVFAGHAELRARAYANLDSAVNHAASAADSARYVERASRFTIRAPEPNTVEANVLEAYQRNLGAILADPDHRCNWDL